MVLFLTFFLLLGGDTFKRKLVRLTGPSLSNKKITVKILDDINHSIQKYLFMMLLTNVLVGLLVWMAFSWIGLENAGAWAVAAGLLHVIPFLGPAVTAVATGMAAFMQFDTFPMALLVCRCVAGHRYLHRNFRHDVDDRANSQVECGRHLHFAAVLGLALGHLGHAAEHSHHRHRESRLAACRAVATGGGVTGGMT